MTLHLTRQHFLMIIKLKKYKENSLVQLKKKTEAWRISATFVKVPKRLKIWKRKQLKAGLESTYYAFSEEKKFHRINGSKSIMIFNRHYKDKLFKFLLQNKTDREAAGVRYNREWTKHERSVILCLPFWSRLVIKVRNKL